MTMLRLVRRLTPACMLSGMLACGGGGGDSAPTVAPPAFTIGGTVSGLANGASVVLRFQGNTDIGVNANGAFTAPGTHPAGTAYSLTVGIQPGSPSQTCTVTNGSGAVASADVSNIVVACVTNTFSLRGTVQGLARGATVVLQNGAVNQAVSANGAFNFTTAFASGSQYQVTIGAQPDSPAQLCVVANAGGAIPGADITDIQVTCTTRTFALGGVVAGLVPGTIVSLHNGADTLNLSANGPFAFSSPVASGTGYLVNVTSQPTGPQQTCVAANAAGIVAAADVTSVLINCSVNTYTLSVSVSGLAGGGLTLSNNGGDILAIGANGNATFATRVASGTNYNVAVAVQPSTGQRQRCTVANPTGSVVSANIAGINVTCANRYVVSGTLDGLEGPEVWLRNNGGDDLRLQANGSFTFGTALAGGVPFNVSVRTQPYLPDQQCVVTQGVGNIGAADVTNVKVKCQTDRYLYVTDGNNDLVTGFAIHSLTGVPRKITPDLPTGHQPQHIVIDPRGNTLFVANTGSNNVSMYGITYSSGMLYEVSGSPFAVGTAPAQLALDSEGQFLFVANSGSDNVSVFDVSGGSLVAVPGSPFAVGSQPVALATSRAAQCCSLYVANQGDNTVSQLNYDSLSGALSPIGPPLVLPMGSQPNGIAVDASSGFVMVSNSNGTVSGFKNPGGGGVLTEPAGSPVSIGGTPTAIFAPALWYPFYLPNPGNHTISILAPDYDGLPTVVETAVSTGAASRAIAGSIDGNFVFVANTAADTISGFLRNPLLTGPLTPVPGTPSGGVSHPTSLAIRNNNQDVYDLGFR